MHLSKRGSKNFGREGLMKTRLIITIWENYKSPIINLLASLLDGPS